MDDEPIRSIRMRGEVEYNDEGKALLVRPGDAVLVRRGILRSILMRCPDGCGETLVVNLDPRMGKAWRLDMRSNRVSLYPSIWRNGGCGSHFIVWLNAIIWCDQFEDGNVEPTYDETLEARVLDALLIDTFRSAEDLATELNEIPWEVIRAAQALVRRELAVSGAPPRRNWFAKA